MIVRLEDEGREDNQNHIDVVRVKKDIVEGDDMKTLSKLVAAGVAVAALFSVAGCGSQNTQQEKDPKTLQGLAL